jgi:hypothetical protein
VGKCIATKEQKDFLKGIQGCSIIVQKHNFYYIMQKERKIKFKFVINSMKLLNDIIFNVF